MYDDGYDEEAADLAASLGQDVVGRGGNQNFSSGGGNTFTDSSGNTTNFRPSTTAGLNQQQFENRFGITDRNPYGQTGFAQFFDKFSKALGGKGVDYSQQFRDLDRLHNRRPGRSQELFQQQQYGLYRNPDIDESGKITSGGIDQLRRGTFQGPVEQINREMGTGEQLARAGMTAIPGIGPMLSGMGETDLYLSSMVTPEMRARENPGLAETLTGGFNSLKDSLSNRLNTLAFGPAQMDTSGAPQLTADQLVAATQAQSAAAPIAIEEANPQGPMMPVESDQRLDDNTVADMLRESRVVDVPTPTSRPNIFDSTLIDQLIAEQQENRDRAAAQREANRDTSLELLQGNLSQAIADSQARKMAQTEELDSVAPRPEMSPAEMLREIISQPPSPRTGGQAQVAELDIPSIADLLNSGLLQDLLTEQGPNTSVPLGGGTLNFNVNPNNPGIEFRRPLQGKDMGVGELLSFLSRRT
tara:strand:+ start:9068 stop:10483 length:1416 start_codon:yes stop_codon:yes gene_type:complete